MSSFSIYMNAQALIMLMGLLIIIGIIAVSIYMNISWNINYVRSSHLNHYEINFEVLVEALRSKNIGIREAAASGLGRLGDVRAVDYLIEALNDQNDIVRGRSLESLGHINHPKAIDTVLEHLSDAKCDKRSYERLSAAIGLAWAYKSGFGTTEQKKAMEELVEKVVYIQVLDSEYFGIQSSGQKRLKFKDFVNN